MKKRILIPLFILVGLSAIPLIIGIFYLYTEAEKVQRSIFVNEVLSAGNAIVDRIENDTIKFGAEGIPMDANFWIQLKEVNPTDTRIKLTIKADIPFMFKMMLDKKLQTGLDQAADMLAQFPYAMWQ